MSDAETREWDAYIDAHTQCKRCGHMLTDCPCTVAEIEDFEENQ